MAAMPASTPHHESPARASIEADQLREFQLRETATLAASSPVAPAPAPSYAVPAVPVKLEWPSDLQQVESDPDKIRAVEQQAPQEQAAPRPKRVRQPLPPVKDEPLVQIETDKSGTESAGAGEKTPV